MDNDKTNLQLSQLEPLKGDIGLEFLWDLHLKLDNDAFEQQDEDRLLYNQKLFNMVEHVDRPGELKQLVEDRETVGPDIQDREDTNWKEFEQYTREKAGQVYHEFFADNYHPETVQQLGRISEMGWDELNRRLSQQEDLDSREAYYFNMVNSVAHSSSLEELEIISLDHYRMEKQKKPSQAMFFERMVDTVFGGSSNYEDMLSEVRGMEGREWEKYVDRLQSCINARHERAESKEEKKAARMIDNLARFSSNSYQLVDATEELLLHQKKTESGDYEAFEDAVEKIYSESLYGENTGRT